MNIGLLRKRPMSAVVIGKHSEYHYNPISPLCFISTTRTNASGSTQRNSSVSFKEVSKFSKMAKLWWKPQYNPLISMNPTRMKFITSQISFHFQTNDGMQRNQCDNDYTPLKCLNALDIGCGGGLTSESLARLGARVTAVDPSVEVAQAAQEHSRMDEATASIQYRGGLSIEDLVMEASQSSGNEDSKLHQYDVITILEVIEHATDPDSLIQAASKLLKKPKVNGTNEHPGGILFLSTINKTAKSFGIAILGGEYITGRLPIGTHDWNQFKSPQDINNLMKKYGLKQIDTKGMILKAPFYDLSWYLHDTDTDVNWIGAYRFQ
jgi:ubiquinone biosynthesis O-methyltransferase